MKQLLMVIPAFIFMMIACEEAYNYRPEINEMKQQIDSLKTVCSSMNENITSLQSIVQALQEKDFVTSVTPIMGDDSIIGYTISFTNSNPISIYHGHSPQIAVLRHEDGLYYWTLDGELMLDVSGKPILAEGIAPILKIESGRWLISVDKGQTWSDAGQATGDKGDTGNTGDKGDTGNTGDKGDTGNTGDKGDRGDSFFQNVSENDEYFFLVLADGTILTLPKEKKLSIVFNDSIDVGIVPGKMTSVRYQLTGWNAQTIVKAIGQGGWFAEVAKGTDSTGVIVVTAPELLSKGEILVFVYDGKDKTIMSSLNFVSGEIVVAQNAYYLDKEAGRIQVPIQTNLSFDLIIPKDAESWLSPTQTRSMRTDTLELVYAANEAHERATVLSFNLSDGSTFKTVAIVQEGELKEPNVYLIKKMGTLGAVLNQTEKDTISRMIIRGEINAADFRVLKSEIPNLEYLDLSAVNCENNEIPNDAFGASSFDGKDANTKIKTVVFPTNLKYIGNRSFNGCVGLRGVLDIPNTVRWIGSQAFYNCYGLSGHLVLPDSLTSISSNSFNKCSGFTGSLYIPEKVRFIQESAFSYCTGFSDTLYIPSSVSRIGEDAFRNCESLLKIVFRMGLNDIGDGAFWSCSRLKGSLDLPDGLKAIGKGAFYLCRSLSGSLKLPNSLTMIGSKAFYRCYELSDTLYLPENLLTLEEEVFYSCSKISHISFNKTLETIKDGAFFDCLRLHGRIVFPYSILSVRNEAFKNCYNVESFRVSSNNVLPFYRAMFPSGATIEVPLAALDVYKDTDGWNSFNIVGY